MTIKHREEDMNKTKTIRRLLCLLLAAAMVFSVALPVFAKFEPPVARMTIVSYKKNSASTGHAWLYFENVSKKTITVGIYKLPPRSGVSVGTFGYVRKEGPGVYYNVESYITNHQGTKGRVSISQLITGQQLEKVSKKINQFKSTWNLARNCSYFAGTVWNTVASNRLAAISTPALLRTSMKKYGLKKNVYHQPVLPNQVFKQKGSTLKQVRKSTLIAGL